MLQGALPFDAQTQTRPEENDSQSCCWHLNSAWSQENSSPQVRDTPFQVSTTKQWLPIKGRSDHTPDTAKFASDRPPLDVEMWVNLKALHTRWRTGAQVASMHLSGTALLFWSLF